MAKKLILSAQEIESLDSFLDSIKEKETKKKRNFGSIDRNQQETSEAKALQRKNIGQQESSDDKGSSHKTAKSALAGHAKAILRNFTVESPQGKHLKQQIDVIRVEIANYKRVGNDEAVTICKEKLEQLKSSYKQLENIVHSYTAEERAERRESARNNEQVKAYDLRIDEINQKIKALREEKSNSLIRKFGELKKQIKEIDFDDFSSSDDILDFDSILDDESLSKKYDIKNQFYEICKIIAERLDIIPEEVGASTQAELRRLFKDSDLIDEINSAEIVKLKDELVDLNIERTSLINDLNGYDDITKLMFSIFDYEDDEENQIEPKAKNVLAANSVPLVLKIAYSTCLKMNLLHYEDDAIAYGMLGVSEALNDWYDKQKSKSSPVPFSIFISKTVAFRIKKGLYELINSGSISGSNAATVFHKYNKSINDKIEKLKESEEYKNIPNDLLRELVEEEETLGLLSVTKESEFKSVVGGDDADDVDMYDFVSKHNYEGNDVTTELETQAMYKNLLDSISEILSMFDVKVNKSGKIVSKKKIFDVYDCAIFKMWAGFTPKNTWLKNASKEDKWTQEEIAEVVLDMMRKNGQPRKSFSQRSVSERLNVIFEKIRKILEKKPELESAFKRIFNYIKDNRESFELESKKHAIENETAFTQQNIVDSEDVDEILDFGDDEISDKSLEEPDLLTQWSSMIDFSGIKLR